MKKAAMLLALLFTLITGAGALAQDEGAIVQSSCNIVQSDEYVLVYCFAQVHNNSDQTICLDEGTLRLMNGEEALSEGRVSRLWPTLLAPGGDGYLFDIVTLDAASGIPAITGLDYDVGYMEVNPAYAGYALDTQARIEISDITGRMSVVCEISNPTDETAFGASVGFGLYTEAGQMVYAGGTRLQNIGIPAGGSVMVRFEVEDELTGQWKSYDALPTQARACAMFSANED